MSKKQNIGKLAVKDFGQEVVGESHYQKALEKIVGRKRDNKQGSYWRGTAKVMHEKKNKHDKYAIVVKIKGKTVGYLPRGEKNKKIIEQLRGKSFELPAAIMGGFKLDKWERKVEGRKRAHYGVWLRIDE